MKKYFYTLFLLVFFLSSLASHQASAQFVSQPTVGDYEDPAAWVGELVPDGSPGQPMTIVEGAVITRNGDFDPARVEIEGALIVNGNCSFGNWGEHFVRNGAVLEVFGDVDISQRFIVEEGGWVIVHGNVSNSNAGTFINGNMIVEGDFSISNGELENTGKLVVGGTFEFNGGGFKSPDGNSNLYLFDPDADHSYAYFELDDKYGGLEDFKRNEQDNAALLDFVASMWPDLGLRAIIWRTNAGSVDWDDAANWIPRRPDENSSVRIGPAEEGAHCPVISAENGLIILRNLSIEAGAELTMKPGAQLTINGKLIIAEGESPGPQSGRLIVEHEYGVGGMSSLITKGLVTGKVSTRMSLPQDQWFYLGSSSKDAVFSDFGAGGDGIIINVYRAKQWWGIKSGLASRTLRAMEGLVTNYLPEISDKDDDGMADERVIEYDGLVHTAEVSREFDETGFHLLANPYPAFIDWEYDEEWVRPDVDPTMWYRAKIGEEMAFVTYNKAAVDQAKIALYPDTEVDFTTEEELALIPPMQAVWIKTLRPGVTVTVEPGARRHGLENSMLKSSSSSIDANVIRIEAENAYSRDGTVIYFADGYSTGYDRGDSEKYFNDSMNIPEIYTRVENRFLAINGLPKLSEDLYSIPLSVRNRVEGSVSLKFDLGYFNGEHTVYLEDKETGVFLDVDRERSYEYAVTNTGDNHERFVLHFVKVATDIEYHPMVIKDESAKEAISIRNIGAQVLVSFGAGVLENVTGRIGVYTVDGRKVSEGEAVTGKTLIVLPNEIGPYIIRAKAGPVEQSQMVFSGLK
ncbi:hypothetical protein [Geofilum rhodophaeum]|uniref:hypothetical protein n=1 Tax=Geofilum rhodophaeum TaxID=1965019 RepID=UPI000B521ADE|nr:hypothetical protein [Geofilum rhodophaeum]